MIDKISLNLIKPSFLNANLAKNQDAKNSVNNQSRPAYAPFNNSYAIAFLGKKDWNKDEIDYYNFRKKLARYEHAYDVASKNESWENDTGIKEGNFRSTKDVQGTYQNFDITQGLKKAMESNITDKDLKKSLDHYYKDYVASRGTVETNELIDRFELKIDRKLFYHKNMIGKKQYTNVELDSLLSETADPKSVEKLYKARYVKQGNLIANDIVNLVKARNAIAQEKGYDNYFQYKLETTYGISEKELFKLFNKVEEQTDEIYQKLSEKDNKTTASTFGISVNEIQPWHLFYAPKDGIYSKVNSIIKKDLKIEDISSSMYKKMGWDIKNLPIKIDLYPRAGKNTFPGLSIDVDTNKDTRVFANIGNDLDGLGILNHEFGHSVYNLGISDRLPYYQRTKASSVTTEAIAEMMRYLPYKEGILKEALNLSEEENLKLNSWSQEYLLKTVRYVLQITNFEHEMYKNPDQDLAKLWYELGHKYMGENIPDKLDNKWATIPHFVTHPAYCQNYLRAEIMAAQIYDKATKDLGPLSKNENTAEYLRKKIFRHGASMSESDLIKYATGKELSVDAFVNQIKDLEA